MSPRVFRRSSICALLGAAALPAAPNARADEPGSTVSGAPSGPPTPRPRPVDAEITSDTAAQFYELRSPSGQTVITRRRLTTTLGVSVYDLMDRPATPLGPTLTFRARLRYDADYGGNGDETSQSRLDRLVPGFSRGPVDLMYGYVEGRRFARGWVSFRLGRQYVTDALGWWSFDGGQVQLTTPWYFTLEAYGGLEQRGGLPLSTARYERDGVWRGDRTDLAQNAYPSFQPNDIAPAVGVAIESAGFTWLHGRATYRRVYNTGEVTASQLANGTRSPVSYDGTRISQERVGYALDGSLATLGGFKAGFNYDLYVATLANVFASVDWFTSRKVTLSLDYDFYRPTFDGDSIWNFFMAMPMNDIGFRSAWDPNPHLSLAGGLHARLFTLPTEPEKGVSSVSPSGFAQAAYYPSSSISPVGGATLSARWRMGEGGFGGRGAADLAGNGNRIGLDVYGDRVLENRYVFQGRVGVWEWNDKLRPDRNATDVGYSVGIGYKLLPKSLVLADFQHDMNRIAGQRFRAMLFLTIALSSTQGANR